MRSIYTSLIAISLSSLLVTSAYADVTGSSEVSCSTYGADALSCNQCFDAGTDYVGDTMAKSFDDVFQSTSTDILLWPKGSLWAGPVELQSAVGVGKSSDYSVSPPASVVWDIGPSGLGDVLTIFAGTRHTIAQMQGGILFTSVSAGANPNKPALRYEYITEAFRYDIATDTANGPAIKHKECAFVSPRFCGDAIVSNGEVCDDGDQNGQPGKCKTNCTPGVQLPVSCDNMTATPLSGAAPLNVAVACTGTNAATYRIDCGNGITNLTNTAVCRYPTMGTYTPRCYVNGNVTSAACAKAITVTPPVACVPGTTTGPQTAPLTATSPGLCPGAQTVGGFTGTTVGTLTTYNWSCNGSAVGGACAATFNSSTAAAGVDLSLKKYASGSDAQDNATSVVVNSGSGFNYTISVANVGTGVLPASLTTVADTLPAGVTLTASPTGIGWICITVGAGVGFSCSRNDTLAANGALFPIITIPVTATGAPAFLVNTGTVTNPNDIILTNNADPAVIALGGGPVGPRCNTISASLASPVAPGASVTYTCTATGYTIPPANLEYRVDCGATTGTWGSSNTGTCLAPASFSTTANVSCAVRDRNLPTVIFTGSSVGSCLRTVTTTGGGGGTPFYVPTCVNGVTSCSQQVHNTLPGCQLTTGGPCYNEAVECANAAPIGRACGPGGGGGGGGSGGGKCGDGVLQPDKGEECDIKGASWCDNNCKVIGLTTPGANPITDLWMTIPYFDRFNRLGYNWLDGQNGKIAFKDNRMVLGKGTKAFTLADTVGFGIKTQYRIPLIIPVDKKLCLQSGGSHITSNTLCTTFGEIANLNGITPWTQGGTTYMNIGQGYYQELNPVLQPRRPNDLPRNPTQQQRDIYVQEMQAHNDWRRYRVVYSNNTPTPTVFKGARKYESPQGYIKLNDAFIGSTPGTDTISLISCSGSNCSSTAVVPLSSLEVRVSDAVVASIGSPSNRSLEEFLNTRTDLFAQFLDLSKVRVNISTTTNNQVTKTTTVTLPVIVGGAADTVSTVEQLEQKYAVNGNKNILSVNGDLTIVCPQNRSTFEMNGVRTVVVNGDLIIKCNIVFTSNDTTSSWAWITKGGDIKISNSNTAVPTVDGITNLAGVYVALKEGNAGGNIVAIENRPTQTILRIDGSMYGNAAPLFESRRYARATSAYDILTTGTVLTYSNRALVSPPPLLSQYLGNYSVQRVIQ